MHCSVRAGRIPAGFNGCVGLKATVGRVSTTGVVPACASLDCLTCLATNVRDAATVMQIMQVCNCMCASKLPQRRHCVKGVHACKLASLVIAQTHSAHSVLIVLLSEVSSKLWTVFKAIHALHKSIQHF